MGRIDLRRRPKPRKEATKAAPAKRTTRAKVVRYVHIKTGLVAEFVKRISVPDGRGGRCECLLCLADGGASLGPYYVAYPVSHWTTLDGKPVS